MLLAIDIGNSNISVGLFDREKTLKFLASLDTDSRKTADQISIDLMNLLHCTAVISTMPAGRSSPAWYRL